MDRTELPLATERDPVAGLPADFAALLAGAFDVHVHGQPDLAASLHNRGDDLAVLRLAHAYGISGWVLKSHLWLTTDRAAFLHREARDLGFSVYGSITLNPPMGGVSAAVVELAAAHGARVVFLPTWGSAADVARGGYISRLLGQLAPSFPGYAARNAISLLTPHLTVRDVHEAMSALGPERIVLSTDAFSRWAPPEPECLRMFVEQLAYLGWQPAQLRQMTAANPKAFLGIVTPEASA